MPHNARFRGSPVDWLRYAHSDLALSRATIAPEILFETLCFHAQQAAEKALKAVLIAKGIAPPRTHNIRTLLDLLPPAMVLPCALQRAAGLTDYAVMSRYPAEIEPVSEEDYREAVRLAEAVITWAEEVI